MASTGRFFGKTVVITGASRGIGKEIALKLAKDGANIVIAAKTAAAHPKLPGTIYTAAEEIEKVGGKALACIVDVRDENSVQQCVQQTFGGIDILVNNASAISLTGTADTEMKRYDLMHQINTRGTFLMSKACLPYLQKGKNPHILNISPPLVMDKKWFQNHVAYTMAKFGMSMCVLGMSEEFRPLGIAVNALWPLTSIWTAAMEMLGGGEAGRTGSRTTAIMADAAYAILSKESSQCTGNFLIDEEVLRSEGVTDFTKYECVPGAPLIPDFFLPEKYSAFFEGSSTHLPGSGKKMSSSLEEVVNAIRGLINADMVKQFGTLFLFELDDVAAASRFVTVNLKEAGGSVLLEETQNPDVRFTCSSDLFCDLFSGVVSPEKAFFAKKLKIKGDISKAMALANLIKKVDRSKL